MRAFLLILLLAAPAMAQLAPVIPVETVWTIQPVQTELLRVVFDKMKDPEAFCAYIAALTPSQLSAVVLALQKAPDALKAVAAQLSPEKLQVLRAALFLADVDAWEKLGDFMGEDTPRPTIPGKFNGTWLDAARERIRQQIANEGYSPAALAEVETLMDAAKKPAVRGSLNQIKGK